MCKYLLLAFSLLFLINCPGLAGQTFFPASRGDYDTAGTVDTPGDTETTGTDDNDAFLWWGGLGIGTGTFPENSLAVGFGLNLAQGSALYGLRAIVAQEFHICIWGPCAPDDNATEIGLLYGRMMKRDYGYLSASAGLGVLFGSEYAYDETTGMYKEDAFVTAGIPLEVQAFFTPLSFVGIGLTGFVDLNPHTVSVGFLAGVQLGRLRE